jgi:GTPase SAR1 family protein
VKKASCNSRNDDTEDENETSEMYQNLNEKQKIIFDRIETHYKNTIFGHQVEALRILIMGTAGTGKSYLIKAIRGRLRTMATNEIKLPVILIAPTGVAAFNINGATVHSTLSIPIMNDKKFDLNSTRLKQL